MATDIRKTFDSITGTLNYMRDRAFYVAMLALLLVGMSVALFPGQTASAAPANLTNPTLEAVAGGVPTCYSQAGWGEHTTTWKLVAGRGGSKTAQSLTLANYKSGDHKLLVTQSVGCAPAVTPGKTYDLSLYYTSTSAKNSLTVFRHSAAGWTYWTDLAQPKAVNAFTQVKVTTPVVPAGTDQISFGLSLSGNGTTVVDDFGFIITPGQDAPAPVDPTTPTVPANPNQLTTNGSLEAGAAMPTGWMLAGWGDATVTSGVSAAAHGGTRAYSVTLAGRTQGDYKLIPNDASGAAVVPGALYDLSVYYKSTTASNSMTVFAHTAAGWGYWTDLKTLPASADWTQATARTAAIPAGVDAIAWGISIYGNGTLITDDYSTLKYADVTAPAPTEATQGKWTVLDYNSPIRAIHSTLLKNGKVLLIAGSGNDLDSFKAGSFKAAVWDPISGVFNVLDVPVDMFCSGHATLPDGRVLIQGGTSAYPTDPTAVNYGGIKDSFVFDPDTNVFQRVNDANEGHWYPTLTQLGDGSIWMAGGLKADTTGAVNTERFDYLTNKWLPTNQVTQNWSFWGLYPHMFLMADGRMFYSGAHTFGNGLPGTGASIYNPTTGQIADVAGLREKDMRDQASSLILPPAQDQKLLITGGGNINGNRPGINLTDIIDLKDAVPAYKPGPDLPGDGKMYVNSTILPDRTVLLSNGGKLNRDNTTNVLTASIYDPATNTMRAVAADPIARNYHSSSILLPDGRVAVFGSNPGDGSFEMRISVYQPGYFFKTARPVVTNVPAQATYGQNFNFGVNTGTKAVKYAQLTRPMSVTHQTDTNVRLVDLPVNVVNGVATVTVTANRNLLPPGYYMLTVTDSDGVPSAAQWILIK